MNLIRVADLDDARLAVYRDLPRANLTALSGRFVVEGRLLLERLLASRYAVESVVVDERRLSLLPEVGDEVPVLVLPAGDVERLIGFNFHRGILGCGLRRSQPGFDELTDLASASATFVACVDIQDPTNLGGILRNCAAFGVDGVLLSGQCADPFSRRVLRVSMGTAFQLRMVSSRDLLRDVKQLRDQQGVELVAMVLDATAEHLEIAPRRGRLALLVGNEAQGLPLEFVQACQRRVTLPMQHGTDSLNAAAASAVFLYHFTRVAPVV